MDAIAPGDTVVADGESGMGLVNPDPGELRGWEERKRGWDDRRKRLGSLVTLPAVTKPSEDEQFEAYRRVAQAFSGRTVIIRTLDVGGDKPIPSLGRLDEANPFLGLRRIRLCVEREEVFLTQLRALLRGRVYGDVTSEGALVWSK